MRPRSEYEEDRRAIIGAAAQSRAISVGQLGDGPLEILGGVPGLVQAIERRLPMVAADHRTILVKLLRYLGPELIAHLKRRQRHEFTDAEMGELSHLFDEARR